MLIWILALWRQWYSLLHNSKSQDSCSSYYESSETYEVTIEPSVTIGDMHYLLYALCFFLIPSYRKLLYKTAHCRNCSSNKTVYCTGRSGQCEISNHRWTGALFFPSSWNLCTISRSCSTNAQQYIVKYESETYEVRNNRTQCNHRWYALFVICALYF